MGPSAKLGYMSENTRQTGLWASLAILSGLGPEDPRSNPGSPINGARFPITPQIPDFCGFLVWDQKTPVRASNCGLTGFASTHSANNPGGLISIICF